jgi:hypothetical protein
MFGQVDTQNLPCIMTGYIGKCFGFFFTPALSVYV